jgi:quinol monooxygenase YgiN
MSITVIVEFTAQPDKIEDLKAAFKAILPDTRAYDGCEGVTVLQNQEAPENIVFVETWANRPVYEKYFAWRVESGALAALGEMVAAPPSIRYLDTVDA